MANIKFSPESVADLQQIKAYIAKDLCDETTAINVISKITKKIRTLETFPNSGTPLSSIVDMNINYRFIVCGNYMSFYKFENETVYIIRVLYGRRNYMQILFDNLGNEDE